MAQQTINVGAAPNDGTGTPLRTAFQYTNSNFTELYTAVGPSGNNIVVPGTATITGDLTVDTSTLKVDSSNNSVGVVNATPLTGIDAGFVVGSIGTVRQITLGLFNVYARMRERDNVNNLSISTNINDSGTKDDATKSSWKLRFGSGNDNLALQRAPVGSTTFSDLLIIDSTGVATFGDGAGGTRMTLNSTGLGVGVTPITGHRISSVGPIGLSGGPNSYVANGNYCSMYYTDGSGASFPFLEYGNLVIQPRNERNVVIATAPTAGNHVARVVVKLGGQVRFVPLAADPSGAESGDVYYNSTSNKLKCYNGTTWNDLF
jgi:hypothetical protein